MRILSQSHPITTPLNVNENAKCAIYLRINWPTNSSEIVLKTILHKKYTKRLKRLGREFLVHNYLEKALFIPGPDKSPFLQQELVQLFFVKVYFGLLQKKRRMRDLSASSQVQKKMSSIHQPVSSSEIVSKTILNEKYTVRLKKLGGESLVRNNLEKALDITGGDKHIPFFNN